MREKETPGIGVWAIARREGDGCDQHVAGMHVAASGMAAGCVPAVGAIHQLLQALDGQLALSVDPDYASWLVLAL